MELLAQLLLNSLIVGSIAALVALGFSLILQVTGTLHFAHGAVYASSAYVVYLLTSVLTLPLPLALLASLVVALGLGVLAELLVYRPLREAGAAPRTLLMSSLALMILVQNILSLAFGNDVKTLAVSYRPSVYEFGPLVITSTKLLILGLSALGCGLLALTVYRTQWGLTLRAMASNPLLAETSGVDRRNTYLLTFALGSALAAPAGVLVGFDSGLAPTIGTFVILLAITAVVVGGVGSFAGTIFGAYAVAAALNVGIWKVGSEWQASIAFILLMVFIFVRPRGLFGRRQVGVEI